MLPLLHDLSTRYSHIVFLVADRLQIYNRAVRAGFDINLSQLIRDFDTDQEYLDQRKIWIDRLAAMLPSPPEEGKWKVIGIEDLADAACFKIFRNVMVLYYACEPFRADIDALAKRHADTRSDRYPLSTKMLLSRGYLLEEIAVSIRIHLFEDIEDEYYLGGQVEALLRLYGGKYGVTVEDLAQFDGETRRRRFFRRQPGDTAGPWIEQVQG